MPLEFYGPWKDFHAIINLHSDLRNIQKTYVATAKHLYRYYVGHHLKRNTNLLTKLSFISLTHFVAFHIELQNTQYCTRHSMSKVHFAPMRLTQAFRVILPFSTFLTRFDRSFSLMLLFCSFKTILMASEADSGDVWTFAPTWNLNWFSLLTLLGGQGWLLGPPCSNWIFRASAFEVVLAVAPRFIVRGVLNLMDPITPLVGSIGCKDSLLLFGVSEMIFGPTPSKSSGKSLFLTDFSNSPTGTGVRCVCCWRRDYMKRTKEKRK